MNKSRQIIYVEIDEEVTSIFDRIKNIRKKAILLVVPRKAVLFQSVVNLKILKNKLKDREKRLIIVTTDRNGKHLAEKIGLKVLSRVEIAQSEVPDEENLKMRIQPIQARRNLTMKDESPKRFTEKKISIRDLIQKFRMHDSKNKKDSGDSLNYFHFIRPSRKFLALIILVSISLFMLIGYIAFPSATVSIRPTFDNISYTVNVTLADKRKNQNLLRQNKPHVIASEVVNTTTKQTKIFNTTSKEFNGKNAKGKITIINTSKEQWKLKKDTRFQNKQGIVFRIERDVIVPASTQNGAGGKEISGTLTVAVEADPFDIYSDTVGTRGNIPPSDFIIPGLTKYNQRLIFGKSNESMTGGITNYKSKVSKEDIKSAKKQIQDNLILMAKEDLKNYIAEMNSLNKTNLILLDDSRYLTTKLIELRIADDLEGSYRDKFEIFAQISAEGVAFDYNQLFAILKKELATRTHPNMQLKKGSVSDKNITYEVMDKDELLGQTKITATIIGIEEFVIDSSKQAGERFGDKVIEKILGLTVKEAESLVGNLPEVDLVRVTTWPFWTNKIPRIKESIDIELMD